MSVTPPHHRVELWRIPVAGRESHCNVCQGSFPSFPHHTLCSPCSYNQFFFVSQVFYRWAAGWTDVLINLRAELRGRHGNIYCRGPWTETTPLILERKKKIFYRLISGQRRPLNCVTAVYFYFCNAVYENNAFWATLCSTLSGHWTKRIAKSPY